MAIVWAVAGMLLILLAFTDLLYTTLSTNGSGVLSGRVARLLWRGFFWASRGNARSHILDFSGMTITISILIVWILTAWAGFSLIFLSDADAVRHGQTHAVATAWEKVYYVGYSLATLGNGDFYATSVFWKLFSIIMSLSGLTMVTIAITYLVQLLTAEIEKRQLALHITALGGTPQTILLNSWNGTTFQQLESDISDLSSRILSHSQHHLAYPVIHYFHSTRLRESASVGLAALDEAVTILLLYIPPGARPSDLKLRSLRTALTTYLMTLKGDFLNPSDKKLPLPDLDPLRQRGIPLMENAETIEKDYDRLARRRRMLRAVIEYGGWTWDDLNAPKFPLEWEQL